MVLAIWIGASVEHVQFNFWLMGGLGGGAIVAAILRLLRGASIPDLRGSPIFALWLATRFFLTPALLLLGLAWLVCAVFRLAATPVILNALELTAIHGLAAIFVTAILADLTAVIRSPGRGRPSGS